MRTPYQEVVITGLGRTLMAGCSLCLAKTGLLPDTPEGLAKANAFRAGHDCPELRNPARCDCGDEYGHCARFQMGEHFAPDRKA